MPLSSRVPAVRLWGPGLSFPGLSFPRLCFLGLFVALVAGGCGRRDDAPPADVRHQPMVFVMVPKGVHPYYEPCYEGFRDAAALHGVQADFQASKVFEVPQDEFQPGRP